LTGHAGYLRGDADDEEEEPEEEEEAASASSVAAAWCAEKSRARDGWEGEERGLARADGAFFPVAAAVVVQATAVAMETAGESDGEAKPPCCQTPRR